VIATITFQRAAPATSSPGPAAVLPCAVHRPGAAAGASPADDTCDTGIITCDVIAYDPEMFTGGSTIYFEAETHCSEDMPQISMGQDVIHDTPIDPNNPLTNSTVVANYHDAWTHNQAACQPGGYAVNASARITPPNGYIVLGSLHAISNTVTFFASDCTPTGGGGGGGCATGTPPVSGQPAARQPDVVPDIISCR
jgi:hypothetical protein